MFLILFIVLIVSFYWLYKKFTENRSVLLDIPAPKGKLILGNAADLISGAVVHLKLTEWAKELGSLYRINIFGKQAVVISGYKEIHEVLVSKGKDFSGRYSIFRTEYLMEDFSDMLTIDFGPAYIHRRKILQRHLKQYGEGIQHIEDLTHQVFDELIQDIEQVNGEAVEIEVMLKKALTDITYLLAFGERIGDEKEREEIIQVGDYMVETIASGNILDVFPWVRFFGNEIFKKLKAMRKLRRKLSDSWSKKDTEINITRRILKDMEENKNLYKERSYDLVTWNLFFGGVETTLSSLSSLMNIVAHYPKVLHKLQKEIDEKLGQDTPVRFHHRNELPYCYATVLELTRYTSILPNAIPHRSMVDTSIQGHKIPKNTMININLWGLLHDTDIWGDPFCFRPDRFIDEGEVIPVDHPLRAALMPFGAGPRVCLGEMFAKTRMFVATCKILQKFDVLPETTIDNQPSCDPRDMRLGAVLYPKKFKVRFVVRK